MDRRRSVTVKLGEREEVTLTGLSNKRGQDVYFGLIAASWKRLFALALVLYILLHALFALIYLACSSGIAGAKEGSFSDAFFFSVQTLSTIGYGTLAPANTCAHVVVTLENAVSIALVAFTTGLFFAKFSVPRARVLFSRSVVVTAGSRRMLKVRLANERANQIVEASLRVTMVIDKPDENDQHMRRLYDLPLVRSTTPLFSVGWTIMHEIDEASALHSLEPSELSRRRMSLIVSMTGIDGTTSQTVHARQIYNCGDVHWNCRFADTVSTDQEGKRTIDLRRFHDVIEDASSGGPATGHS